MAEQRLFHTIADKINELIDEGLFPPGAKLPGERDLAQRFGVSRVPVREAQIALQAVGRVEIRVGSGVYVCESPANANILLPKVSAFELTEARSLIESETAALAAKVITDDDLEKLDELIDQMAEGDEAASLAADREFHATIARASGNTALVHTIEPLWRMREELPNVKHSYDAVCQDNVETRAAEHRNILNALKARNPAAARRAMRQHFLRLINALLDATEEEALRKVQKRANASRKRYLQMAKIG